MRIRIAALGLCAFAFLAANVSAQNAGEPASPANAPSELQTDKDKLSYSLGFHFADYLRRGKMEFDVELIIQGLRDSMAEKPMRLPLEDMAKRIEQFHYSMVEVAKERREQEALKNIAAEQEFLQKNAADPSVVQLPSGLQYKVIQEGAGQTPTETSTVRINYVGRLLDGTEFINTFKENRPREWQVNKMLKGWVEALPLMKEGARWQLFIPASLGFGPRGLLPKIPPSSCLIYEVELIGIVDDAVPQPAASVDAKEPAVGDREGEYQAEDETPKSAAP